MVGRRKLYDLEQEKEQMKLPTHQQFLDAGFTRHEAIALACQNPIEAAVDFVGVADRDDQTAVLITPDPDAAPGAFGLAVESLATVLWKRGHDLSATGDEIDHGNMVDRAIERKCFLGFDRGRFAICRPGAIPVSWVAGWRGIDVLIVHDRIINTGPDFQLLEWAMNSLRKPAAIFQSGAITLKS